LPVEERRALESAVAAEFGPAAAGLEFRVSSAARDVVAVGVTLRASNSVDAIADAVAAVDRALMRTGLFEEFDVTGKVLDVAPLT
jgi:hypothetical protein